MNELFDYQLHRPGQNRGERFSDTRFQTVGEGIPDVVIAGLQNHPIGIDVAVSYRVGRRGRSHGNPVDTDSHALLRAQRTNKIKRRFHVLALVVTVRNNCGIAASVAAKVEEKDIETAAGKEARSILHGGPVRPIAVEEDNPVFGRCLAAQQHPGVQPQSVGAQERQGLHLAVPHSRNAVVITALSWAYQDPARNQSAAKVRQRGESCRPQGYLAYLLQSHPVHRGNFRLRALFYLYRIMFEQCRGFLRSSRQSAVGSFCPLPTACSFFRGDL